MKYDYVYKKQTKINRSDFVNQWMEILKEAKNYFGITFQLVGSSKRNLVLAELNKQNKPISNYDFDYQLIITSIKEKWEAGNDAKKIKDYFINQFQKKFSNWSIENSTTAITLKNSNYLYSFDIVICSKFKNESFKVIKRAKPSQGQDEYIWQEIAEYKNHKENLRLIKGAEKWKKVREIYKSKKITYKNNPERKSYLIFIETVKEAND